MTRRLHTADEWERVWVSGDAWNHLMLWNPLPPQRQPLLELVAADMDLQYWNRGEPFRVDAAGGAYMPLFGMCAVSERPAGARA